MAAIDLDGRAIEIVIIPLVIHARRHTVGALREVCRHETDGDRHAITVESFASLRLRSDFLARGAPLSNLSCYALQPSWISAKLADGTVYALEFTTRDQHAPIRREPEVWPSPLKRRRLRS